MKKIVLIKNRKSKKGFSLLELLLVLGIIAALVVAAFIVYPKVQVSHWQWQQPGHQVLQALLLPLPMLTCQQRNVPKLLPPQRVISIPQVWEQQVMC